LRWPGPTVCVTVEHVKSLPTDTAMPEQLAPFTWSHRQALHDRPSVAPVYQYETPVFTGQACVPSNIMQLDAEAIGTHAWPPQPPPTIDAAQKRVMVDQVIGVSVGVPDGVHPFETDAMNALACTP